MSGAAAPIAGRPPVELPPLAIAPGGRSVPPDDLIAEVEAPAALLAEVVMLAGDRAVFPSRLAVVAELAMEYDSVRARAAGRRDHVMSIRPDLVRMRPVSTGQIIDQPEQLRDPLPAGGDGDGR